MNTECDVLIVGARVAGSSLALMLGELGHHVMLIDRATFPSPANSTHFFRGNGFVGTLKRLGLLDQALALESPPFYCEYWYLHAAETPEIAPPQDPGDIGYNLSVRREPLDDLLIRAAKQHPLIEVVEGTSFLKPIWNGDRVTGAMIETADGEHSIASKLLVGADGQHSRVASAVDAVHEIDDDPLRMILYRYVTGFEGPLFGDGAGPEFSVVENEIAYAFPSDQGVSCIGVSFPLSTFGDGWRDPESTLTTGLRRHPGVSERALSGVPVSKIMGDSRNANFVKVPHGPGWALVGDAGLRQDPWTGAGMDCAGVHAGFLADAIDDWLSGRSNESTAMLRYHQQRNEHGMPRFEETQRLARDLRQMEMMQTH